MFISCHSKGFLFLRTTKMSVMNNEQWQLLQNRFAQCWILEAESVKLASEPHRVGCSQLVSSTLLDEFSKVAKSHKLASETVKKPLRIRGDENQAITPRKCEHVFGLKRRQNSRFLLHLKFGTALVLVLALVLVSVLRWSKPSGIGSLTEPIRTNSPL